MKKKKKIQIEIILEKEVQQYKKEQNYGILLKMKILK